MVVFRVAETMPNYASGTEQLLGLLRARTQARHLRLPRTGLHEGGRANAFALVILLGLGLFLAAKVEFRSRTSNDVLYLYGITVTSIVLAQMAIAFGRYRDLAAQAHGALHEGLPDTAWPLVSCIVAVHNERDVIEQCVASLVGQTYARREIIVVDDASTDGTRAALEALAGRYEITVILLDRNVGKKRALGTGILQASGSVYAFTDSDSVWAPDAVARTVSILSSHPEVGAVSGHCRALNGDENVLTRIQDSWYEGQFSIRKAFESAFGAVTCVSGPLAVFRKEAVYNYIPAWESDNFLGQEFRFATDRMLTAYVLGGGHVGEALKRRHAGSPFLRTDYPARDWRIVYCRSAKAWTVVPDTFSKLVKQQVRWKKSFLRNLFFTGRFYWRRPIVPALGYYLHVLFVVAGPFVAFRHLVYIPLHGNLESAVLYLAGIVVVGSMFGLAHWRVEPDSRHWIYRPLMSLISTTLLSWLLVYSLLTIRRMRWAR
jgi:cellulose synthase/poly-beta-1,6-N-acetylglucosamine synthase-like glycosyltransferase